MSFQTNVTDFVPNNVTANVTPPESSSSLETLQNFSFYFNTIALGSVCILGMLGNLTSVLVLQRDRHNRVAIFLLQVLALADSFLLVVSLLVLTIAYGFLKRYMNHFDKLIIPYMIKYVNPIGIISQCVVIWSTVLLALNRYAAVCRPFSSKRWLKLSSARIQVAIILCFSVGFNLPRFFIFEIVDDPSQSINSTNGTVVAAKKVSHTSLGSNKAFNLYYLSIFYTSIILILPLILLTALNVPLIRQLQKSKKRMKDNCLSYDGKNEDNITWTMVVIILELVIFHTPERICDIIRSLSGNVNSKPILLYAMNISNFLVIINSSTDFIVYYVLKSRFRREFWRKIYACLKKEDDFSTEDGQTSINLGGRLSIARSGSKVPGCTDTEFDSDLISNQNRYRRLKGSENGQQRSNSLTNQKVSEKFSKDAKEVKPLSVELNGGKLYSMVSDPGIKADLQDVNGHSKAVPVHS